MKHTGMSRPMDELGRIVIPKEIRSTLNIKEKDKLDISVDGDSIILTKNSERCIICGAADELQTIEGKDICTACVDKIKNL